MGAYLAIGAVFLLLLGAYSVIADLIDWLTD